ncbi:hypothetical protein DPMN_153195 [Dreissena polymorpha]|uniref:Uncharacterized protein n=1 Tax=Dreissena polymorpha TaxID=45954 RepID=A0A9D4FI69_DREPO|nr:hypothetical protein DPMN_153195 [Dreissena polymorpha]
MTRANVSVSSCNAINNKQSKSKYSSPYSASSVGIGIAWTTHLDTSRTTRARPLVSTIIKRIVSAMRLFAGTYFNSDLLESCVKCTVISKRKFERRFRKMVLNACE